MYPNIVIIYIVIGDRQQQPYVFIVLTIILLALSCSQRSSVASTKLCTQVLNEF